MENVIETYRKLKYLTETIDEGNAERLREYTDELTVPPNSLPLLSHSHEKSLKKHTSATSSSTSILSQKSTGTGPGPGTANLNNSNIVNPTIPEVEHDSEEEEDTNAMFIRDKFHIRNDQLFTDNAATSKELLDLLSGLSNEEIQPILDEIITTTYELDEQRQESQYEENYDLFISLIQKMKNSSTSRIDQLKHSLQLLIHRQREFFDITIEKYKQEYGFYRMKNRHLELLNQIQKYSFKLSEIKYELSLKQEEFNISAEELRNRYEQELESMIRKLLQTIEEKKEEINELTSKNQSIQQDIQRICNDLSVVLHELDREEKAKAYASIYGNNKKYIDNRPAPPALPKITTEKIEEAFQQARIDQNSIASSPKKGAKNDSKAGAKGTSNRSPKGNIKGSPTQKGTMNKSSQVAAPQVTSSVGLDVAENQAIEPAVQAPEEGYDSNHIFQVFPFLDTNEITEDMVIQSLKITDALQLEVEGKKKELQEQEQKVNEEKLKNQNLLKSEENKALERMKMMVANLETKIEADGKRVELLQTLVKNLTSESKGDHGKQRYKSIHHKDDTSHRKTGLASTRSSFARGANDQIVQGERNDSVGKRANSDEKEEDATDRADKEETGEIDYENLSEVEGNVLKYQEFYDKCQSILKVEREKILSREKTPRTRTTSTGRKSRPISSAVSTVKPFSSQGSAHPSQEDRDAHGTRGEAEGEEYYNTNNLFSNEKQTIKRIITPQQVSKVHKIMEMFDYYTNLSELSELDKVNNTLIPYSNVPLGWSSSSASEKVSKGGDRGYGRSGMASRSNKSRDSPSREFSPSRSIRSATPTSRAKSVTQRSFTFPEDEKHDNAVLPPSSNSQLLEFENVNSSLSSAGRNTASTSHGRRAAITSPQGKPVSPRSRSPGSIMENREETEVLTNTGTSKGGLSREKGHQLTIALQDRENQQFFGENFGYKIAIEQISTIYNILLKWNHPTADQMSASNIVNNSIILQTDREENELLTIEVLKSQIQNLLIKCKNLYKQNTYFHTIIKDLSKELIHDIKKNNQYTSELITEISNLRWNQNTLPGKYQLEIDVSKERLMQLKKECKAWEGKVSKRRVTNIRLSHLLSENSKNVRKALPLKSSFQMVQAMVQENTGDSKKDEAAVPTNSMEPHPSPRSHVPILYSSSLSHGPQPFPSIPIQADNTSLDVGGIHNTVAYSGGNRPASQKSELGIDFTSAPIQPLQPDRSSPQKTHNHRSNQSTSNSRVSTKQQNSK